MKTHAVNVMRLGFWVLFVVVGAVPLMAADERTTPDASTTETTSVKEEATTDASSETTLAEAVEETAGERSIEVCAISLSPARLLDLREGEPIAHRAIGYVSLYGFSLENSTQPPKISSRFTETAIGASSEMIKLVTDHIAVGEWGGRWRRWSFF